MVELEQSGCSGSWPCQMCGSVSTDAFGSRIGELGAATGLSKISRRRFRVYERLLPPQPVMATLDKVRERPDSRFVLTASSHREIEH